MQAGFCCLKSEAKILSKSLILFGSPGWIRTMAAGALQRALNAVAAKSTVENKIGGSFQNERGFRFQNRQR